MKHAKETVFEGLGLGEKETPHGVAAGGPEGELGKDAPELLEGGDVPAPAPAAPVFGFRRKATGGF